MAWEDEVPLDSLSDKHELMPYDPTDAELIQVVAFDHGGRTLEVIVPLLYDGTRIGEVVSAAVSGRTVFLLCRHDRPLDDTHGVLGLLVVAVPHRDGRYRAAIAHATYSLEGSKELAGLGLYPPPGPASDAVSPPGATGAGPGQPPSEADFRALKNALPFRPFLVQTNSGKRFPVYDPETMMVVPGGDLLILTSQSGGIEMIDPAYIAAIREIAPDDPEAFRPVPPAGDEAEDRRGIQADLRRLRARLDGVEGTTHRVDLDLRRKIHEVDHNLSESLRDLRVQMRELETDQNRFYFYVWPLRIAFIALALSLYWVFAANMRSIKHDFTINRIEDNLRRSEDDSAKRREVLDLRLDELKAAVRQAQEQTTPAR